RLRTEGVDLVIEGPAYRLEVPRARVVFSPGFFWGRSLSFRDIEMESPRLILRTSPTPSRETTPLRKPLLIRSFRATNATVTYEHPPQGTLVLRGVQATGSLGQGSLSLTSTGGTWQRPGDEVPAGPTQARLRISDRL